MDENWEFKGWLGTFLSIPKCLLISDEFYLLFVFERTD
jgi:hypothetical protein